MYLPALLPSLLQHYDSSSPKMDQRLVIWEESAEPIFHKWLLVTLYACSQEVKISGSCQITAQLAKDWHTSRKRLIVDKIKIQLLPSSGTGIDIFHPPSSRNGSPKERFLVSGHRGRRRRCDNASQWSRPVEDKHPTRIQCRSVA
jgi:hypothetical protein